MLMHYIPEVTAVEEVDEDTARLEAEQRDFAIKTKAEEKLSFE